MNQKALYQIHVGKPVATQKHVTDDKDIIFIEAEEVPAFGVNEYPAIEAPKDIPVEIPGGVYEYPKRERLVKIPR